MEREEGGTCFKIMEGRKEERNRGSRGEDVESEGGGGGGRWRGKWRGEGRKKSQKAGGVIIPSCNNSTTDCILTGRETERP